MQVPDYNRLTPSEAFALQAGLRDQVSLVPLQQEVRVIAGADISFNKFSDVVYAGIVLLEFPSLRILHRESVVTRCTFPYVPGLLAFREVPALMEVWNRLPQKPDVLVLDGQGTAHPRKMGVACHFGILAQTPTLGCGKSLLCGTFAPVAEEAGSYSDLVYKGEKIGEVLRTKTRVNPVYVSPGHLISQEQSRALMMACTRGYRIPEPTRQAHLWVNEVRLADREQTAGLTDPGSAL